MQSPNNSPERLDQDVKTAKAQLIPARFTVGDATRAYEEWGANCGPAALALVAGKSLDEIRPFMGEFEQKCYTNPTLMFDSLKRLGLSYEYHRRAHVIFPTFGLVRIQWEGPWTAPGVPIRVRYRHAHWIATQEIPNKERNIFDVNCMCVGGWVPMSEWTGKVVPWLLKECQPKANGKWHATHVIEVAPPVAPTEPTPQSTCGDNNDG